MPRRVVTPARSVQVEPEGGCPFAGPQGKIQRGKHGGATLRYVAHLNRAGGNKII